MSLPSSLPSRTFLDYDCTLSPLVDAPDSDTIPLWTKNALSAIETRLHTAIVIGCSRKSVMDMVRIQSLVHAASHGLDINAPDGRSSIGVARYFLPFIKAARDALMALTMRFLGAAVEGNSFSVAMPPQYAVGLRSIQHLYIASVHSQYWLCTLACCVMEGHKELWLTF